MGNRWLCVECLSSRPRLVQAPYSFYPSIPADYLHEEVDDRLVPVAVGRAVRGAWRGRWRRARRELGADLVGEPILGRLCGTRKDRQVSVLKMWGS